MKVVVMIPIKLNNEKTIYSNSVSGSCKFSC